MEEEEDKGWSKPVGPGVASHTATGHVERWLSGSGGGTSSSPKLDWRGCIYNTCGTYCTVDEFNNELERWSEERLLGLDHGSLLNFVRAHWASNKEMRNASPLVLLNYMVGRNWDWNYVRYFLWCGSVFFKWWGLIDDGHSSMYRACSVLCNIKHVSFQSTIHRSLFCLAKLSSISSHTFWKFHLAIFFAQFYNLWGTTSALIMSILKPMYATHSLPFQYLNSLQYIH